MKTLYHFYHPFDKGKKWFEFESHFDPKDIWIGIYWKRYPKGIQVYLCLLPLLPLSFYIQWQ